MKIRSLISVITAAIILMSFPLSHMAAGDADGDGDLVCYCCSAPGEKCSMISCSGCCGCGHRTVTAVDRWSTEMILDSFHLASPLGFVFVEAQGDRSPVSVSLDVPTKPPNTI